VSVSLCMDYFTTRAYSYTGNDPNLRNLRATAPLVWKIIEDSKADGLNVLIYGESHHLDLVKNILGLDLVNLSVVLEDLNCFILGPSNYR